MPGPAFNGEAMHNHMPPSEKRRARWLPPGARFTPDTTVPGQASFAGVGFDRGDLAPPGEALAALADYASQRVAVVPAWGAILRALGDLPAAPTDAAADEAVQFECVLSSGTGNADADLLLTFVELVLWCASVYGPPDIVGGVHYRVNVSPRLFGFDPASKRLEPMRFAIRASVGCQVRPGLRWAYLRPGANRDLSPRQVPLGNTLPGVAALAFAATQPEYVSRMRLSSNRPGFRLAGVEIEVEVPGYPTASPFARGPWIYFGDALGPVFYVDLYPLDVALPGHATVPTLRHPSRAVSP